MKRTWLLLISLFNLCILVAQPTYHIKHYSVNDGMSQGIVQTIIQDKKGFLWFGTWNGLNKFDGYTFKNYKTSYKDGYILNTNRISQIAETKYGDIWCQAYDGRVYMFDNQTEKFIDVLGCGRTLLQLTADRFKRICFPENIWVVTSEAYADIVREQLPEIPESNILKEPCRRNTAPCIAYVSWRIKKLNPKANVVVTPSDHIVMDVAEFERVITSGLAFTAETDSILTLGMKPNRPETGYGYIQADLGFASARNKEIYRVDSFKEKPDFATASRYIQKNNYFWNAGIFVWNVSTIVNAFRVYQPAIAQIFEQLMPIYGSEQEQEAIFRSVRIYRWIMPSWRK